MSIKGFSINGNVSRYDYNALDNKPSGGGDGLTEEAKQALLQCFQKVAYIDANGQTYYQALYDALYAAPKVLTSINASYYQSGEVLTTDTLDSLRKDIVVTAYYSDSTSTTVTDYTLSGNLTAGISTIDVNYNGMTDTISVTVTAVAGTYTISNHLTGCTTSNSATTIEEGGSYTATITASSGYTLTGATASVTMGGNAVTGAYSNGTISIANVTGDIVITVTAVARTVSSISAVFTQGDNVFYAGDSLDSLKPYLVVTAAYSDGGYETVNAYTLTGTLSVGTSTITASYSGKTDTFSVTVSERELPSGYSKVEYVASESSSTSGPVVVTGLTLSGVGDCVIEAGLMCTDTSGSTGKFAIATRANNSSTVTTGLAITFPPTWTEVGVFVGDSVKITANGGESIKNVRQDVVATVTSSSASITNGDASNTMQTTPRAYNVAPLSLFGTKKYNLGQIGNPFSGRIYYVRVTEDGTLKMNLIPCVRDSDSAPGWYDMVADGFVTATDPTELTAGPAVV